MLVRIAIRIRCFASEFFKVHRTTDDEIHILQYRMGKFYLSSWFANTPFRFKFCVIFVDRLLVLPNSAHIGHTCVTLMTTDLCGAYEVAIGTSRRGFIAFELVRFGPK